jgi:hypothetical protein
MDGHDAARDGGCGVKTPRPIYPDPTVRFGDLRVLPYTPGGFVIYDERRPVLGRGVAHVSTLEKACQTWLAESERKAAAG